MADKKIKPYNELLQKALKKFKVESFYDLSSYKDPKQMVDFMRYLDDLITGDVDDQDKPVYTKKDPDLHHSIDLTTGKLPTSITKNEKLKKVPKKLEHGNVVQENNKYKVRPVTLKQLKKISNKGYLGIVFKDAIDNLNEWKIGINDLLLSEGYNKSKIKNNISGILKYKNNLILVSKNNKLIESNKKSWKLRFENYSNLKTFLIETGEMSKADIGPGGENYEWAKAIEADVKKLVKLTNGKLSFKGMEAFDKYQGPYANTNFGKIWDAGIESEFVLYMEDKEWLGNVNELADAINGDKEAIEIVKNNTIRHREMNESLNKKTKYGEPEGEEEIKNVKMDKLDSNEGKFEDVENTFEDPEIEEQEKIQKELNENEEDLSYEESYPVGSFFMWQGKEWDPKKRKSVPVKKKIRIIRVNGTDVIGQPVGSDSRYIYREPEKYLKPIEDLNEYPYVWESKTNLYKAKIKKLVEGLITVKQLNESVLKKTLKESFWVSRSDYKQVGAKNTKNGIEFFNAAGGPRGWRAKLDQIEKMLKSTNGEVTDDILKIMYSVLNKYERALVNKYPNNPIEAIDVLYNNDKRIIPLGVYLWLKKVKDDGVKVNMSNGNAFSY